MNGSNTPTEFTLTPENFLETLLEWMPDQLQTMRTYSAGAIRITRSWAYHLECQYMNTVGGEKFRIVDRTPDGDSGSHYLEPIGMDDDIVLAYAARVEKCFASMKRFNEIRKGQDPKPLEMKMVFNPGPFEQVK